MDYFLATTVVSINTLFCVCVCVYVCIYMKKDMYRRILQSVMDDEYIGRDVSLLFQTRNVTKVVCLSQP